MRDEIKMNAAQQVFWIEVLGTIVGAILVYYLIIKPWLRKEDGLYECDFCKKRFTNSKKCLEHEKECPKRK